MQSLALVHHPRCGKDSTLKVIDKYLLKHICDIELSLRTINDNFKIETSIDLNEIILIFKIKTEFFTGADIIFYDMYKYINEKHIGGKNSCEGLMIWRLLDCMLFYWSCHHPASYKEHEQQLNNIDVKLEVYRFKI